jgi:hypothetical protein
MEVGVQEVLVAEEAEVVTAREMVEQVVEVLVSVEVLVEDQADQVAVALAGEVVKLENLVHGLLTELRLILIAVTGEEMEELFHRK